MRIIELGHPATPIGPWRLLAQPRAMGAMLGVSWWWCTERKGGHIVLTAQKGDVFTCGWKKTSAFLWTCPVACSTSMNKDNTAIPRVSSPFCSITSFTAKCSNHTSLVTAEGPQRGPGGMALLKLNILPQSCYRKTAKECTQVQFCTLGFVWISRLSPAAPQLVEFYWWKNLMSK